MRFNQPIMWAVLGLVAVTLLVQPWGDYPINDDWEHARGVERLARTGEFVVDTDMTVSLVLQAYAAATLVHVVGFSHTALPIVVSRRRLPIAPRPVS
jgi:hypothetical protein